MVYWIQSGSDWTSLSKWGPCNSKNIFSLIHISPSSRCYQRKIKCLKQIWKSHFWALHGDIRSKASSRDYPKYCHHFVDKIFCGWSVMVANVPQLTTIVKYTILFPVQHPYLLGGNIDQMLLNGLKTRNLSYGGLTLEGLFKFIHAKTVRMQTPQY